MSGFPVRLVGEGVDWPAWVQAVGSLIALAIAVGIPIIQRHLERRDRRLASLQMEVERLNLIGQTRVHLRWRPLSAHAGASVSLKVLRPSTVTVAIRPERRRRPPAR